MKNIFAILCSLVLVVTLPTCSCLKKKKADKKETVATINNAVDSISIELVEEQEKEAIKKF